MADSAGHSDTPGKEHAQPRRVAVIGVHGVARHEPGATANAMADLLLSLPSFDPKTAEPKEGRAVCAQNAPREFEPFESVGIQIPLQPVCVKEPWEKPKYHRFSKWFQEGSTRFARGIEGRHLEERPGATGRRWSVKLLQDYYGAADSNAYISTRLSGRRKGDKTGIHIYEMFWADLARPTNSLISFFLALVQLILHLPSLSRLAIDTRPDPDWSWKLFQALHRYASRVLQIALPLGKVMVLVVLTVAIPAVTKVQSLRLVSAVVGGVIVAAVWFLSMRWAKKPVFPGVAPWLALSFLPAIAIAALIFVLIQEDVWNEVFVLVIATWVLGAILVGLALNAYETVRPGVQIAGWFCYAAAIVRFGMFGHRASGWDRDTSYWVQQASFWTVQWLVSLLRFSWITLALLSILSALMGAIAWRRVRGASARAQARAAVRTSRFALALPLFLFVLITSFLWAGLFSIARAIRNPFFDRTVISHPAPHPHWKALQSVDVFPNASIAQNFPDACAEKCTVDCSQCAFIQASQQEIQPDYLKGVLAWNFGYGSYFVAIITMGALLILGWWALPSVLTERFPARREFSPHETEPPRSSTNKESVWMGSWTSRGLDSIAVITWVIWSAIFLLPLAFLYVGPLSNSYLEELRTHSRLATKMIICWSIYVAGTAAIMAALVHNGSEILRIILDVDTYLRTGPIEQTPRAKIFERYVSLLRYVAQYQFSDGTSYDSIVIVAHSLGSLISGDLLNLLQHQKNDPGLRRLGFGPDKEQNKIPIRLFTMGNPTRQLLNRFFPYLYDWVRQSPDNGARQLIAPLEKPPSKLEEEAEELFPHPIDLGVEEWVNAYRAGDYVGRSLWLTEWYRRTDGGDASGQFPEPITKISDAGGTRVEFCIGAGAHTHYWDDTAPDIAEELNILLSK